VHETQYPATDYTRVRTLPREIVFPAMAVLRAYYSPWTMREVILPFIELARGLAIDKWRLDGQAPAPPYVRGFPAIQVDPTGPTEVKESEDLKPRDWSCYPILVDGTEVIVDFGDWHNVSHAAFSHPHWLRYHFHSSSKNSPMLGSLTTTTYSDWSPYDSLQRRVRERRDARPPTLILNNQSPYGHTESRRNRRFMVRGMLHWHFPDRARFDWSTQEDFFEKAAEALCFVAAPGSWENSLDRSQIQMIGLGVPTITPMIYDQCCDGLLQPGIHYLACRQDYRDVPDLINWLESHRDEAAAISHNAWLFFQEFCTPLAVWSYVKDRIDHGPRHWRQGVDDDLSPPALYKPEPQGLA
jgi:hypothetical protein